MGRYIQTDGAKGKVEVLKRVGADETSPMTSFQEIPEGKALVVVSDNGHFEAAIYVDSQGELDFVNETPDVFPLTWLLMEEKVVLQYFENQE